MAPRPEAAIPLIAVAFCKICVPDTNGFDLSGVVVAAAAEY